MLKPEVSNDTNINIKSSYCRRHKISIYIQAIADTNPNGEIILKKSGLSSKQYHSRVSQIKATGLIKRKSGKYYLCSLGNVV